MANINHSSKAKTAAPETPSRNKLTIETAITNILKDQKHKLANHHLNSFKQKGRK